MSPEESDAALEDLIATTERNCRDDDPPTPIPDLDAMTDRELDAFVGDRRRLSEGDYTGFPRAVIGLRVLALLLLKARQLQAADERRYGRPGHGRKTKPDADSTGPAVEAVTDNGPSPLPPQGTVS
jgi:hypothetical protein